MSPDVLLPWFAPKLSQAVSRVVQSLGRRAVLERGQTLNSSLFFNRLVYVHDGLLAQGVINPGGSRLFMLTLSAQGSFGATAGAVDAVDNLPRRYWAATHCEVLTLMPEIVLSLSEVDERLNHELASYALRHAMSERLGLMVTQAGSIEERLGVFCTSLLAAQGQYAPEKSKASRQRWVASRVLPSRKLITALLAARGEEINDVVHRWADQGVLRWVNGEFALEAELLDHYWQWMQPFVRMHEDLVPMSAKATVFDRLELDLKR